MQHIALNAEAIDGVRAGYDFVPAGGALAPGALGTGLRRAFSLRHKAALVCRLRGIG